MQGGGFPIAAFGPFAMALLHGWSESFAGGWVRHLACIAVTALLLRAWPARCADAVKADELQSAASPA